jgi:hypothetical protein
MIRFIGTALRQIFRQFEPKTTNIGKQGSWRLWRARCRRGGSRKDPGVGLSGRLESWTSGLSLVEAGLSAWRNSA